MSQSPRVPQLFDLSSRVFLVVGGARDLGFEMAAALAEAGAEGMVTSRNADSIAKAAARLREESGRRVEGLSLDATDESQIRSTVEEIIKRFGRIDILVNNVGGGALARPDEPTVLEERALPDWERLQRLNLTAPWLTTKHVAPAMRRQRSGSIINIASIAGMIGRDRRVYPEGMVPQTLDYAASKGGLIALTRDLAAYLGPDGIRVNAVSPGGIQRNQPPAFIEEYSRKAILGRMGRAAELKGAVLFLASDASSYITGHNLVIDGGFSVWQ